MTFNSSCSFAGIANMLESKGLDFQDYEVALGMELPYIVAKCDGGYMAGSMLQEKKYFDIFLKKNGYELIENYVDRPEDRKSTRLNSSHSGQSRMPSSA